MAKKKVKGGDPVEREVALAQIATLKSTIDSLWDKAAKIADKAGVSFSYGAPGKDYGGGIYYPKIPKDWVVIDNNEHEGEDPNQDHPEHQDYHPWNDGGEYDYDWSTGNWISSSERC